MFKSTSELDSERASTLLGPSGPYFKLIYHVSVVYDSWIDSRFTLVYKGILVIMQGCVRDNEQGLYIRLID